MSNRDVQQTRRRVLNTAGGAVAGLTVAAADHSHPDVETVAAEAFSSDSAWLDGDPNSFGEGADSAEVFFEWDRESASGFSNETTHLTTTSTGVRRAPRRPRVGHRVRGPGSERDRSDHRLSPRRGQI